MDAAVVLHPESPSQQSRCSEIGSPLEGEFGPLFFLVTFKENGKEIRFIEKYCNMQIIEKVDYRVGQIYE